MEDAGELAVRPFLHDALAVVDDLVDARVAGADVAGQPHLRREALADDVPAELQPAHFRRRLEARPLGDHVRATREQTPARGQRGRGRTQTLTRRRADRVAHDQQMIADHHAAAIAIGREVDEVVRDHQVAGIQQPVETADAGVRKDPLDAGPVKHAEDLA